MANDQGGQGKDKQDNPKGSTEEGMGEEKVKEEEGYYSEIGRKGEEEGQKDDQSGMGVDEGDEEAGV